MNPNMLALKNILIGSIQDRVVWCHENSVSCSEDADLQCMWHDVFTPKPTGKRAAPPAIPKKVKKSPPTKKDKKVKKSASPKVSLAERQEAPIDHSKCACRIWASGLDNVQCHSAAVDGEYCKTHAKKVASEGGWWLGLVTGSRVEEPFGPPSVKKPGRHFWSDQSQPEKKTRSGGKKKIPKPDPTPEETPVEKVETLVEDAEEKAETHEEDAEEKKTPVEKEETPVEDAEEKKTLVEDAEEKAETLVEDAEEKAETLEEDAEEKETPVEKEETPEGPENSGNIDLLVVSPRPTQEQVDESSDQISNLSTDHNTYSTRELDVDEIDSDSSSEDESDDE